MLPIPLFYCVLLSIPIHLVILKQLLELTLKSSCRRENRTILCRGQMYWCKTVRVKSGSSCCKKLFSNYFWRCLSKAAVMIKRWGVPRSAFRLSTITCSVLLLLLSSFCCITLGRKISMKLLRLLSWPWPSSPPSYILFVPQYGSLEATFLSKGVGSVAQLHYLNLILYIIIILQMEAKQNVAINWLAHFGHRTHFAGNVNRLATKRMETCFLKASPCKTARK